MEVDDEAVEDDVLPWWGVRIAPGNTVLASVLVDTVKDTPTIGVDVVDDDPNTVGGGWPPPMEVSKLDRLLSSDGAANGADGGGLRFLTIRRSSSC